MRPGSESWLSPLGITREGSESTPRGEEARLCSADEAPDGVQHLWVFWMGASVPSWRLLTGEKACQEILRVDKLPEG